MRKNIKFPATDTEGERKEEKKRETKGGKKIKKN